MIRIQESFIGNLLSPSVYKTKKIVKIHICVEKKLKKYYNYTHG